MRIMGGERDEEKNRIVTVALGIIQPIVKFKNSEGIPKSCVEKCCGVIDSIGQESEREIRSSARSFGAVGMWTEWSVRAVGCG